MDDNVVRIPSELAYVLLHPVQRLSLIEEARIQVAVLPDILACQEAKGADAVVEVNKDNVMARALDNLAPVEVRVRVISIPAALGEQPDRQVEISRCIGRLEHVDEQAVLP